MASAMRPDGGEMQLMTEGAGDAPVGDYGSVDMMQAPQQAAPPQPRRGNAKDMAQQALETAKADLRMGFNDLPALLAPWLLFSLCFVPVALLAEPAGGYCAFTLAATIVTGFLVFSSGRAWKALAAACLVSAVLGGYLGFYDRWKYLYPYYVYGRSPFHSDVLPSDFPDAYRDAGYLSFSQDSHVEASKGLGYRSGDLWCVAPILGRQQTSGGDLKQRRANFWAVGKNCCQNRASFECGNSWRDVAHGGLVVFDFSRDGDPVVPTYKLAIAAAAQTYDLIVPDEPILVSWATNPATAIAEIYSDAVGFVWTALLLTLGVVPLIALTFACFGLTLTKKEGEDSDHWHADEFEQMNFVGFDFSGKEYSRELQLGLMGQRCYWSGEVIYDYGFHLANKHMFLGCLFCHPAHPYEKWERLCVLILVSLFIMFPVSAVSVRFGQYSATRMMFLLLFVTLPRNALKMYMIQIAQQDKVLELEEGRDPDHALTRTAFQWEITFLFGASMVCFAMCAACSSYIMGAQAEPLATVLWYNCDGLGFAAIVEPLLDMVVPYVGLDDYAGSWTFGFFGRWRRERDHFATTGAAMDLSPDMRRPKAQQPGVEEEGGGSEVGTYGGFPGGTGVPIDDAAAMAAAISGHTRPWQDGADRARHAFDRPLFRDAGTELLLDPEARKNKRKQKTACGRITKDACGGDWWSVPRKPSRRGQRQAEARDSSRDPFSTQPVDQSFAGGY